MPYITVFMGLAGIFEELLFRGIIQNLLYMFFDMEWLAITITSLLFLAFHFSYFKKPIMYINIAIPGFVFGVLYFATDNLMTPILVHSFQTKVA
ncbi:CPBP family intramembrane glutamic endopeptidase [Paenibacillus provencensis]|uniref:CPBP family intramembrane glutamic endopeptidase n=1 Tax=Paenibacillus provencensis TaxID=441151 RepID=A0ABW3PMH0_9BACL|nr:CPBP family intramembrane glutamic endopeptidase [Paenibacillus sp. MER 78]MCM3126841.1 CPBP family intramembrane metalloprotease [Paenibacillus sp. MER 78]